MADLGAIGAQLSEAQSATAPSADAVSLNFGFPCTSILPLPVWAPVGADALWAVPVNGTITGVVKEGATPVSGRKVRCYNRATMILVGESITDGSGNYSFTGLDPADKFVLFVLDPNNAYNGVIKDNVSPA